MTHKCHQIWIISDQIFKTGCDNKNNAASKDEISSIADSMLASIAFNDAISVMTSAPWPIMYSHLNHIVIMLPLSLRRDNFYNTLHWTVLDPREVWSHNFLCVFDSWNLITSLNYSAPLIDTLPIDSSILQVLTEDSSQDRGHPFNVPSAWSVHLGYNSPWAEVRSYVVLASRQVSEPVNLPFNINNEMCNVDLRTCNLIIWILAGFQVIESNS